MAGSRAIAWWSCAAMGSLAGCFESDAARGLPCTSDESCGSLSCEYGVCGGPTRCEAGAGVGDYCYVVTEESFPVGEAPAALAIADVNSDFTRDIVTADADSRGVSILLGDGTGTFASHDLGMPELSSAPRAIGLGHLDGNGWSDLAVVTEDGTVRAVFVGEDGALGTIAEVATSVPGATRPTIADFVEDGSGVRDVAVLGDEGVFVARNIDLASFEPTWRTTLVDSPRDMRTIQNAAGDPAFAYVARLANDDISSLDRKADGTFSSVQSIEVGRGPVSFAIADLNSDDYVDVLVVSSDGGLWLTKGKSAERNEWSPPEQVYDLGWVPSTLDVLDLDDDGDPDVVVSGATPDGHADVFLLENDGEGRIIYGGALGLRHASAAALADLDRDDVPEVVITAADDGVVRLARRAKAPPMPGDDDGTEDGTTGVSVSSANEDGPVDDGSETFGDEGVPETGVDPTAGGDCISIGVVGPVELGRCDPLPAYGYHDHLAFARVDFDYTDDVVAVADDGYGATRLVAFCASGYGDPYAGGGPVNCLDLPLPTTATGIAGGRFAAASPAIAVTHTDALLTIAMPAPETNIWNLVSLPLEGAGLAEPRFADLALDNEPELLFVDDAGLSISMATEPSMPSLVFAGAGVHAARGIAMPPDAKGEPGFTPELAFAVEDDGTGDLAGAIFLMDWLGPEAVETATPVPLIANPMLAGLRDFEFVSNDPSGYSFIGIVGAERQLAFVFVPNDDEPLIAIEEGFTDVTSFVLTSLDGEPVYNDVVFVGSLSGQPPALHVIVDSDGADYQLEITDIASPTDVALWGVLCGDGQFVTTEILVSTAFGIERLRALNGCL